VLRPDASYGGAAFGSALRVLDVQRTNRPDLLVGAPSYKGNDGAVQLLNSAPFTGADNPNSGVFSGFDVFGMPLVNADATALQVRMVDTGDRVLVLGSQELEIDIVQPDPDDEGSTVVCAMSGNETTFSFDLRMSIPHTIGGPPTNVTLAFDADDGELVDPTTYTGDNFTAALVVLTVSDSGFGDSDPSNDTVTVALGPLHIWSCNAWRDPKIGLGACVGGATPLDEDCDWEGAPLSFTRFSSLDETCE